MRIGRIEIDLDDLQYHLTADELEIVHLYLNGNKEIETIRPLIEIITEGELTLYTKEDFSVSYLYNGCEYNPVSEIQLQEFITSKVIDPSKEVSREYYSNFLYIDGQCIDPTTGKETIDAAFYACLIEFSHHSIMTYYIFKWSPHDYFGIEVEH
ncbi:hypothetical protein [Chryseobacterium sp.]|uniref:hypothetical protein n=1 Tax=Chryseobacterium sp. TaxID=1871047 RepID=UPI00321960ED